MNHLSPLFLAPLALVALAGCTSNESSGGRDATADAGLSEATASRPPASPDSPTPGAETGADGVIRLSGTGGLTVGEPVPADSGFTSGGAAPGSGCQLYTSRAVPGVTALVEGGVVQRITVGKGADAALEEGIAVGSTLAQAKSAFPGFVQTPHKYVEAPAAYLTQPGDDPRLRFEIGADGRVEAIHVGVMPQLAYVEGCS